MADAEVERAAYLARLKARLIAQRDGYVAPVPVPPPPAPEPPPAGPVQSTHIVTPTVVSSPAARRMRRGDALAIALIARKLAANANVCDAQVLAVIGRKLAKLTGAHEAYAIANDVLSLAVDDGRE